MKYLLPLALGYKYRFATAGMTNNYMMALLMKVDGDTDNIPLSLVENSMGDAMRF